MFLFLSEFDCPDVPLWRGIWPAENKNRQVAHREGKTVSLHRMKTERQLQRKETVSLHRMKTERQLQRKENSLHRMKTESYREGKTDYT